MNRDRYQLISKFLHLNDNDTYVPRGNDQHDPCHEFRPIGDLVNTTFSAAYNMARDLTIDESNGGVQGKKTFMEKEVNN